MEPNRNLRHGTGIGTRALARAITPTYICKRSTPMARQSICLHLHPLDYTPSVPKPRPHLLALAPYSAARHEHPDASAAMAAGALLDANENPDPHVQQACGTVPLNRYPDPMCSALREALATWLELPAANLVCANGSDELIDLLIRLYGPPGAAIATTPPTYGMYEVQAAILGLDVRAVPLRITADADAPFALDVDGLDCAARQRDAAGQPTNPIVFLCNPNNPTGTLIAVETILTLVDGNPDTLFIVDEAYIEFMLDPAGRLPASLALHAPSRANLVVLRTFSKAWGLAGARLGYAIAHTDVIDLLNRIKLPYNVSALTQAAGCAALEDRAAFEAGVRDLVRRRDDLMAALRERKLEILPTAANFFCVRMPVGVDASQIHRRLAAEHQVLVRDRSSLPGLERCLRISAGTDVEQQRLLGALDQVFATLPAPPAA